MPHHKIQDKIELGIGKFRRFTQTTLQKRLVQRSLAQRTGECVRCGACCRLAFECVFLMKSGSRTTCLIHKLKPDNCKFFPITPMDIADRDKVRPGVPCGYRFPVPAGRGHRSRA